jgi:hypothetical protein
MRIDECPPSEEIPIIDDDEGEDFGEFADLFI